MDRVWPSWSSLEKLFNSIVKNDVTNKLFFSNRLTVESEQKRIKQLRLCCKSPWLFAGLDRPWGNSSSVLPTLTTTKDSDWQPKRRQARITCGQRWSRKAKTDSFVQGFVVVPSFALLENCQIDPKSPIKLMQTNSLFIDFPVLFCFILVLQKTAFSSQPALRSCWAWPPNDLRRHIQCPQGVPPRSAARRGWQRCFASTAPGRFLEKTFKLGGFLGCFLDTSNWSFFGSFLRTSWLRETKSWSKCSLYWVLLGFVKKLDFAKSVSEEMVTRNEVDLFGLSYSLLWQKMTENPWTGSYLGPSSLLRLILQFW